MTLPPGQHRVSGFPRFGTHLHARAPAIPADPTLEIAGAVTEPVLIPLSELATFPRREMTADFHCVAGWSATGLRWEGVPFAAFFRQVIEPALQPDADVTHLAFRGLDGYRSLATLEDALEDDVMLAEHLDGQPIPSDHGGPLRLVSPRQYGFVSTKHLCRIEVRTGDVAERPGPASSWRRLAFRTPLFEMHPRARVWEEERNLHLPGRLLRPINRVLIPPFRYLAARGSEERK
jgi:DMSO/TMAO reductase YedYZ molybdopterin-dependent catalytic subunit